MSKNCYGSVRLLTIPTRTQKRLYRCCMGKRSSYRCMEKRSSYRCKLSGNGCFNNETGWGQNATPFPHLVGPCHIMIASPPCVMIGLHLIVSSSHVNNQKSLLEIKRRSSSDVLYFPSPTSFNQITQLCLSKIEAFGCC